MPIKILMAEDSSTNRILFSMTIERMGHTVIIAASGEEAVDLFSKDNYDLVLLDLNMPRMNGIETALCIQKINTKKVPVYAVSGLPSDEMEERFGESGIRRCLIKPLDRSKLLEILQECGLDKNPVAPDADGARSPARVLGAYAKELRSRAAVCLRALQSSEEEALLREAQTIHGLAQLLKTNDLIVAASRVEKSCMSFNTKALPLHVQELSRVCINVAQQVENSLTAPEEKLH